MKDIVFVGDRFFVLEQLLKLPHKKLTIFAKKQSYLERELLRRNIPFFSLTSKNDLIEKVKELHFQLFISNGCPYILPIKELKTNKQIFINIHPSFLPNLRGNNPINAAILFGKDIGATCHLMDDDIDNGDIITRIKIPMSKDLDVGLLYQLCFMAEAEVFLKAYKMNFSATIKNIKKKNMIEYIRKEEDMYINFNDDIDKIVRQVRAFNTLSQGARFFWKESLYKVLDAEIITNRYLLSKINNYANLEIVFIYDNAIIIRKNNSFLKLRNIIGDFQKFTIGNILT